MFGEGIAYPELVVVIMNEWQWYVVGTLLTGKGVLAKRIRHVRFSYFYGLQRGVRAGEGGIGGVTHKDLIRIWQMYLFAALFRFIVEQEELNRYNISPRSTIHLAKQNQERSDNIFSRLLI